MGLQIQNAFALPYSIRYIFPIVLLWYYNSNTCWAHPAKLILFPSSPGEEIIEINGEDCPFGAYNITDTTFSCACITGVWAFFEDRCQRPTLVVAGVDNYCFELKNKVSKVALLSSPSASYSQNSTIVIFSQDMSVLNERIQLQGDEGLRNTKKSSRYGEDLSFITTGMGSWSVKTPSAFECLQPEAPNSENFFCGFDISEQKSNIVEIAESCLDSSAGNIKPAKCLPFHAEPGKCPYSPLIFKRGPTLSNSKHRQERSVDNGGQRGRFFLPGSLLMKNYTVESPNSNDTEGAPVPAWPKNSSASVRSEIWNYMLRTAEKISGLREDKETKYSALSFRLLVLSKILLQKACPDHYIKDTFYDISVSVFLNTLHNAYKFEEVMLDYPTEQRLIKALTQCIENVTESYPFLDRKKKQLDENGTLTCKTDVGTYRYKNDMLYQEELQVAPNVSSISYDPLIDTAWHVFTHAHSACYPFFIHSDHHRFTTVMMPLFTNGINDIWFRGNFSLMTERDPYSNALGSTYAHMMYINHCSTFSRLESDYPWDLLRPERRKESYRKRRDTKQEYECMKDTYRNDCF